jgi:hypothetical protein
MFIRIGKDGSTKGSNSTFDAASRILAPGESVYDTNTNRIIYVNNDRGVLPDFDVNTFQWSPALDKPQFEQIIPLNFTGDIKPATQEELNLFPEGSLRTVDGRQEMLAGDVWRVLEGTSIGLDAFSSTSTGTGTGTGDGPGDGPGSGTGDGPGSGTGDGNGGGNGDGTGGGTGAGTGEGLSSEPTTNNQRFILDLLKYVPWPA